jgi:hypothetical protein
LAVGQRRHDRAGDVEEQRRLALAGQRVDVRAGVVVDGAAIASSASACSAGVRRARAASAASGDGGAAASAPASAAATAPAAFTWVSLGRSARMPSRAAPPGSRRSSCVGYRGSAKPAPRLSWARYAASARSRTIATSAASAGVRLMRRLRRRPPGARPRC